MDTWIEILKENDYLSVKRFIKDGADVNESGETDESVLATALKYKCDMDLLMLLVEGGADIYDFDEEGVSIFDMAVTYGHLEMVKYLLDKGIDVNITNRRSGFTLLMAATCYGRVEIAKILLANGADERKIDAKGFSAIDFARKMNKKSILELFDYDPENPLNKGHAR